MRNDYKKYMFKQVKNNNTKEYYILINKDWIEVSESIFKVCRNSYQKMYQDGLRDQKYNIQNFEDIEKAEIHSLEFCCDTECYIINEIYHKDLIEKLKRIISFLDIKEKEIIHALYFDGKTEHQFARELGITQQTVNYRKKKLLKKLKNSLLK